MSGINVSQLDDLIKKCENILDSINTNSDRLLGSMKDLSDSYDGKALNIILSKFCDQNVKFKNISTALEEYLVVLKDVRKSYVLQDVRFSQQLGKL